MIYDELPSSWRFVDDEKKLSKYTACESCNEENPIVLTHIDTLPSFIFRTTGNFFTPISFDLTEVDGTVIDLSSEIANMELFVIGTYTYVAYNTTTFISTPLATGTYTATISDGTTTFYSEPIHICDDITKCIKFNWTNTCDLAGIPYAYLSTAFGTPFLNTFSADLKLVNAEYETEKEKLENMLRQTDNFYQSQTRTFSLKNPVVPDWFARAIQVMQMHSTITVLYDIDTNHNGVYNTTIEECAVTTSPNDDCNSTMEIKFRQDDAVISTLCCVNASPEACLESCYDVVGFKNDIVSPNVGDNAIDDVDSGVIVQWDGDSWNVKDSTCTYVYNASILNYMFYDGDVWNSTPDITSLVVTGTLGTEAYITIYGYVMPDTWVYIGVDSGAGCVYGEQAYLPADLVAGIDLTVANLSSVDLCVKSQNHNCIYGERTVTFSL